VRIWRITKIGAGPSSSSSTRVSLSSLVSSHASRRSVPAAGPPAARQAQAQHHQVVRPRRGGDEQGGAHEGGDHDTLEAAQEEQYLRWVDEPAPDKADFYSLEIRTVE
jgi:hypothetical protein